MILHPPQKPAPGADARVGRTYICVVIGITVLFYWKILLTHQFSLLTGYEAANQAYSWFTFWISSIRHGSWPLWDPYTFSGHIFSGEMQTGSFYPFYLLMALVPPTREGLLSPTVYHAMIVFAHVLAAWFMVRLARGFGLTNFSGLIAGICFSLGGFLSRLPGWPHLLNSGIWLPAIFFYLIRATRAEQVGRVVVNSSFAGLALGLSILAGGLHLSIMQAIGVLTATVYHFWRTRLAENRQSIWGRGILIVFVVGFVASASGAVQLLPSMEYSSHALRFLSATVTLPATKKIPYYYLNDQLYANGFFNFIFAFAYGGQVGSGEVLNPYFGVFPLFLAGIGIWKRWQHHWVPYLTGLALAAFIYSLGAVSLLNGILYVVTPYLWLAREAPRFIYLADFCLAILAAFGAEIVFTRLPREYWKPLSRLLQWVLIAVVVAFVVPAIYGQPALNPWAALSLLLIGISCLLFQYIFSGHVGASVRFLAIALILLDLSAFDWSASNLTEMAAKGTDDLARLQSCRGLTRFLKSEDGLFRTKMVVDSAPNIGDAFQVQTTGGNGVSLAIEYAQFMGHIDLLNVKYLIKPATATDPDPIYQDGTWKIYRNPRAFPRAWLVHDTVVEPSRARLLERLDDPTIDLHREALVGTELDTRLDTDVDAGSESVHFENYEAQAIDLSVHTSGQALLVLSELCYPGWKASINGHSTRIWKVDGVLRGIIVPAGNSRIVLHYEPTAIYIGGMASLASYGVFLPVLVAPFGRWKRLARNWWSQGGHIPSR